MAKSQQLFREIKYIALSLTILKDYGTFREIKEIVYLGNVLSLVFQQVITDSAFCREFPSSTELNNMNIIEIEKIVQKNKMVEKTIIKKQKKQSENNETKKRVNNIWKWKGGKHRERQCKHFRFSLRAS